MANFGENDYRTGARERLAEASVLHREKFFAGATYLAGRAVEGMLRAVIWKRDPHIRSGNATLETGHDLRQLLGTIAKLGLLRSDGPDVEFRANIQKIARLWFNDMRFVSTRYLERRWRKVGVLHPRHDMAHGVLEYYGWCVKVVKRCEALCEP